MRSSPPGNWAVFSVRSPITASVRRFTTWTAAAPPIPVFSEMASEPATEMDVVESSAAHHGACAEVIAGDGIEHVSCTHGDIGLAADLGDRGVVDAAVDHHAVEAEILGPSARAADGDVQHLGGGDVAKAVGIETNSILDLCQGVILEMSDEDGRSDRGRRVGSAHPERRVRCDPFLGIELPRVEVRSSRDPQIAQAGRLDVAAECRHVGFARGVHHHGLTAGPEARVLVDQSAGFDHGIPNVVEQNDGNGTRNAGFRLPGGNRLGFVVDQVVREPEVAVQVRGQGAEVALMNPSGRLEAPLEPCQSNVSV